MDTRQYKPHGKKILEVKTQSDLQNHHEEAGRIVLTELKEVDRVFTFVRRHSTLDKFGIDWVVGRYFKVHGHGREFRFHIQQKTCQKDACLFRQFNPCIPVWIHRAEFSILEGKVSVLSLTVDMLIRARSPFIDFFKPHLVTLENSKQGFSKAAI